MTNIINLNQTEQRKFVFNRAGHWKIIFENLSGRLDFEIRHRGVKLEIKGLYRGQGSKQFQLSTTQRHIAPDSSSKLTIKGVLKQRSQLLHHGLIKIEKNAKNSQAILESRALLLSPHSFLESQPSLEILNNKVVCRHAVSASPPDPEEKFLLQSRGITKKKSQELIVKEFLK